MRNLAPVQILAEFGLRPTTTDPQLFAKHDDHEQLQLIVPTHVDDLKGAEGG